MMEKKTVRKHSSLKGMTNKRGQIFQIVTGMVGAIIGIVFLLFGGLYAIGILNLPSFFPTGSFAANVTQLAVNNYTQGTADLSSRIPTVMGIAGALLAIGAIVLLVIYLRRGFQSGGGNVGGGL